jgi:signal transduction histidine kinase
LVLSEDQKTAKMLVDQVIKKYDDEEKDLSALENHLDFNVNSKIHRYAFVIDYETQKIMAHPNSELLGQNSFALINSSESEESILENLKKSDGHWVYYNFTNPETGDVEPKTSWFKLHDGLIFGSGFYN